MLDYFFEFVEFILLDLEFSKCVVIEDDMDFLFLNFGMIVVYYYISYIIIELFSFLLMVKIKLKGFFEIFFNVLEYMCLFMRFGEDELIWKLVMY